MKVITTTDKSAQSKARELVVAFVDESKKIISHGLNAELVALSKNPLHHDFKGKFKETCLLYSNHGPAKRLLLLGIGKSSELNAHRLRVIGAQIASVSKSLELSSPALLIAPQLKSLKAGELAQSLAEGLILSQLGFSRFKSDTKDNSVRFYDCDILLTPALRKDAERGIERGTIIAKGVNWARTIIHTPGGHLTPNDLASEAEHLFKNSKQKSKMKGEFWSRNELVKHKFGGLLGVGQGSKNPPRFIVLEYWGTKKSEAPLVLVGKGVTFDSGGLSLKPPASMETMKYDMAGAATMLAVFKIVSELALKVNLVTLVPTAENMPSGEAIRPGDILTMASGKTVEVLNTDAEGRLILADALYWASTKYKPRAIVDAATLTGACAVAVGEAAAGLFTNSKKLEAALQLASQEAHEHFWPLPNFDDFYASLIKSDVADLKNIGGKEAGASTASIFLRHFVHNNVPWAHLDIAGCGWYDAPRDFISQKGPSGVPIRSLVDFVESGFTKRF